MPAPGILERPSPLARGAVFPLALGLVVLLGVVAQFRSYASPDTGFLLDEAARVLDGARPYVDLVEMNPPLTVLLNMAAVAVSRVLGISDILVYRLGCTAVFLGVLFLAASMLRRLLPDAVLSRRGIVLLLAFALFALPRHDFGEREHLVLALVLPYLLLAAARASARAVPAGVAGLIGLLAAGAFGLKPHFVLLWVVVEGYLRLTRRFGRGAVLPETAAISGALALYALGILIWAPGYLQMVRMFAPVYTGFLYVPFWELLLRGPGALLTLYVALTWLALGRLAQPRELATVFVVGALACLVAGASQQKGFSYHFYPSLALATVALGLLASSRGVPLRGWVLRVYRVVAVSVLATVVVVTCVRNVQAAIQPARDAEQELMEKVLPVVRERAAGERVYVMSYNISSAFPLINYAGAHSASRFPQLWILGSAYLDQLRSSRPLRYREPSEMSASERYLNQAVFEDLRDQQPKLLVVLQHARDLPANGFRRLSYVAYFSRDPRIARILGQYQLVADVGDFLVYERVAKGSVRSGPPPGVQPGTHDIIQPAAAGTLPVRVGHPGFLLALCAFLVSVVLASIAERTSSSARIAPGPA
jgi:hypothetical protein